MTGRAQSPRVGALVVTYFPDVGIVARLDRLLQEVRRVVIVDNGSNPNALGWTERYAHRAEVSLFRNAKNEGLGAALNRGMKVLADEGYNWVLTLDQDSTVTDGLVAALIETLAAEGVADDIALVGSNRRDPEAPGVDRRYLRPRSRFPYFELVPCAQLGSDGVTLVITSGTLTNMAAYQRLGPFREDFFIDFIDSEYCLRARKSGYRILVSRKAELLHRVGTQTREWLLGIRIAPMHHAPLRKYYIFRNGVQVMKAYGRLFPHWLVYQLLALTEVLVASVFFERDKIAKFRACLFGCWDGLRGRSGPARRAF